MAKSNTFGDRVETLLAEDNVFFSAEQFAREIGLLGDQQQEWATDLLDRMVTLVKNKMDTSSSSQARKMYRGWLVKLSRSLDAYGIRDWIWISDNVYPLPEGEERNEEVMDSPSNSRDSMDNGEDPDINLQAPGSRNEHKNQVDRPVRLKYPEASHNADSSSRSSHSSSYTSRSHRQRERKESGSVRDGDRDRLHRQRERKESGSVRDGDRDRLHRQRERKESGSVRDGDRDRLHRQRDRKESGSVRDGDRERLHRQREMKSFHSSSYSSSIHRHRETKESMSSSVHVSDGEHEELYDDRSSHSGSYSPGVHQHSETKEFMSSPVHTGGEDQERQHDRLSHSSSYSTGSHRQRETKECSSVHSDDEEDQEKLHASNPKRPRLSLDGIKDQVLSAQSSHSRAYTLSHIKEVREAIQIQFQKEPRKRSRSTVCLVPECTQASQGEASYPKVHAFLHHIPSIFDQRLPPYDKRIVNLRIQGLRQVITWLMGRPANLEQLVSFVNMQHMFETLGLSQVSHEQHAAMVAVCDYLSIPLPSKFTLAPLNSVGGLVHWKVLYLLSALLQPKDRENWIARFATPPYLARNVPSHYPEAVDCHFHPDRLREVAKRPKASISELLDIGEVEFATRIILVGAVAVYCDPDNFPTVRELSNFPASVMTAVGLHPKHANRSTTFVRNALMEIKSLMQTSHIFALGSIGLDHSAPEKYWVQQMNIVRQIVPLVKTSQVLVICCEGIEGDSGMEAHLLLLHLLKPLSRSQKIHVHSFKGNETILGWWLQAFPEACFSFNNSVSDFDVDQITALQAVEDYHLLLESDAPHFSLSGEAYSAPNQLYHIAEIVAGHRNAAVEDILTLTKKNALRLYRGAC